MVTGQQVKVYQGRLSRIETDAKHWTTGIICGIDYNTQTVKVKIIGHHYGNVFTGNKGIYTYGFCRIRQ